MLLGHPRDRMKQLLALALAGAAGSVGRWAVSGWIYRLLGDRFAYGTLVVNVLGCVVMGLVMETVVLSNVIPHGWRVPITVGFLGAFTTYSTFGYETMRYVEIGNWPSALLNIFATLVLCLGATWLGFLTARAVF